MSLKTRWEWCICLVILVWFCTFYWIIMLITQVMSQAPCSLSRWNVHNDSVLLQLHTDQWIGWFQYLKCQLEISDGVDLHKILCIQSVYVTSCLANFHVNFALNDLFSSSYHIWSPTSFRDFSTCLNTETRLFFSQSQLEYVLPIIIP